MEISHVTLLSRLNEVVFKGLLFWIRCWFVWIDYLHTFSDHIRTDFQTKLIFFIIPSPMIFKIFISSSKEGYSRIWLKQYDQGWKMYTVKKISKRDVVIYLSYGFIEKKMSVRLSVCLSDRLPLNFYISYFFFPRTTRKIATKFGTKQSSLMGIPVCLNEGPPPFSWGR